MTIQPIKQDTLTGELLRVATTVLGQPFTKLVGAQISAISDGHLELYVDNREELSQQNGFIHGGVIGYLADNACAAVAGTMRPEGALGAVTAEYKINILRPSVGERAIVRANMIRRGKSQCVTEARVSCLNNGEEKLVAVALATISYLYP
ncbi:MAG: PaaI family thioesterase [Candidatus Phaeomarinobacter sp.]